MAESPGMQKPYSTKLSKIIKKISNSNELDKMYVKRKVANKEELDFLIEALKMTVAEGTAASLSTEDFCSYGKTGTSEVFDVNINEYSDSVFVASYASVFPCEIP